MQKTKKYTTGGLSTIKEEEYYPSERKTSMKNKHFLFY